jgi:hypothetical protein
MKPKPKRKTTSRVKTAISTLKPGWALKKGSKFITKLVEATGIPSAYSSVVAWFAERVILAGILIVSTSFVSGVVFTVYLSEPIVDSQAFNLVNMKARAAQQQIIDIASPLFSALVKENREPEVELQKVELAERKSKLKNYLTTKKSPFAEDDAALDALVASKNMKMIVAISFVESTFGQRCYYYNCSGIGGSPPTLRKYKSYAEWIVDFDSLLERRYKDLPPEKFMGLYVQPGSPNWLYGVKKVLQEFKDLEIG